MSLIEATLAIVIHRWIPARVDRDRIQATVGAALESGGSSAVALRELMSLVALGFRLRCRDATNDVPRRILAQGAFVGTVISAVLFGVKLAGAPTVVVLSVGIVFPSALLLVGWFDPRLAVATVVIWGWRLAAVNHGAFFSDVRRVGVDLSVSTLVIRWTLMAIGVISAIVISRVAIRRATLI